jgi:hypothetical protein
LSFFFPFALIGGPWALRRSAGCTVPAGQPKFNEQRRKKTYASGLAVMMMVVGQLDTLYNTHALLSPTLRFNKY